MKVWTKLRQRRSTGTDGAVPKAMDLWRCNERTQNMQVNQLQGTRHLDPGGRTKERGRVEGGCGFRELGRGTVLPS
jgi:hypothetical protein